MPTEACTCTSAPGDHAQRENSGAGERAPFDAPARDPLDPELIEFAGNGHMLSGYLYRPSGAGPFPAIVFNHGSEQSPGRKLGQAWFYVPHGFVLFVPHRRGHGESRHAGDYIVDRWNEGGRDPAVLVNELDAQVDDVMAAVDHLREQTFVDDERIAVVGCSFGGILSLLAAEHGTGLIAAINFAGASYRWGKDAPLRERMKRAARNAKVPVFFLQAENDHDTTPTRTLHAELGDVKKVSRMRIFPPYGATVREGHGFCAGGEKPPWGEDVLAFLSRTMNLDGSSRSRR